MCNYSQLVKEAGIAEGETKTRAMDIAALMEKGFSFEESVDLLNVPAEQWDDIREEIKKQKAE